MRTRGRIVFLFQPAEEGVPAEERPAGAERMVAEGVLTNQSGVDSQGRRTIDVLAAMPGGAQPVLSTLDDTVGRRDREDITYRGV